MSVITLTTDFGNKDNFVGVMKGVMIGINPRIHVVDLCHDISPQDILAAAFSLKTAYRFFPKGTIHVVVVDPGVGSDRLPILIKTKDYFFIGPDNGILSLAAQEQELEAVIYLDNPEFYLDPVSCNFHGRDIFAPVAAQLTKGINYRLFGKAVKDFKKIVLPRPKVDKNVISGEIAYVDRFGNLITNIDEGFKDKLNCPIIHIKGKIIKGISESYVSAGKGNLLALWSSLGYLEVAIDSGSAKDTLGAQVGDKLKIENK